jgi:hypothetical protein
LGLITAVDPNTHSIEDSLEIGSYGNIYNSIGVTPERRNKWEEKYGMDSHGSDGQGGYLAAGFPVFSKVAWTYIDPIELSRKETLELIEECTQLIALSGHAVAKEEAERIQQFAQRAISKSLVVRFGHP